MSEQSIFISIILGIVQGVSEFLPISSSGHLILASWLMEGKPLSLAVNTALHFGTLLSVLTYFWKDWYHIAIKTQARVFKGIASKESDILLPALILGSVPAGVIGILGKDQIERLFHHPLSVAVPLFLVGFILWWADKSSDATKGMEELSIRDGFLIGLAQACALIPGVSRSGATITAARLLSFNREQAARFSFLLGTPAMGGAAILHIKDFLASWNHPDFIAGVLCSFIVGCFAIRFFLRFIKTFGFLAFALYRAMIASAIFMLSLLGHI